MSDISCCRGTDTGIDQPTFNVPLPSFQVTAASALLFCTSALFATTTFEVCTKLAFAYSASMMSPLVLW